MANVGSWKPDRLDTIHYIHKLAEARVGEGYSVISGCDVHEKGTPDMDVVVDSGEIFYGDIYKTVAGNNVTISAANGTNDRIDVIYVDSSGVAQVHTGDALPVSDPLGNAIWTQYESPYPKTGCPAGVIIALVYVPANDTSIENAQIEDIAQWGAYKIAKLQATVTHDGGASQSIGTSPAFCDLIRATIRCTQASGGLATVDIGWAGHISDVIEDADVPKALNGTFVARNPIDEVTDATEFIATIGGGDALGEWVITLTFVSFD